MKIPALAFVTIAGGLALDVLEVPWARLLVVNWSWAALSWIFWISESEMRLQLSLCVILGALGELLLMGVWGLYDYRDGALPGFVPAGHALAYAAACTLSLHVLPWWPYALLVIITPWVLWAGWTGFDTQGLVWLPLLVLFLTSRERKLYLALFVTAFVIEAYGTLLGAWQYYSPEPLFGLATTNPPVTVGAIYCLLAWLVRSCSHWTYRRLVY